MSEYPVKALDSGDLSFPTSSPDRHHDLQNLKDRLSRGRCARQWMKGFLPDGCRVLGSRASKALYPCQFPCLHDLHPPGKISERATISDGVEGSGGE